MELNKLLRKGAPSPIFFWILLAIFFYVVTKTSGLLLEFVHSERLWPDEALYAWLGECLYADPLLLFSRDMPFPPALPMLFSVLRIFSEGDLVGRVAMLVIHMIGACGLCLLGYRLGSLFQGVVAVIFLEHSAQYFFHGSTLLQDEPMAVLCIWIAICLAELRDRREWPVDWGIGVLAGLAVMTKISGLLVIPWIAAVMAFSLPGKPFFHKLKRMAIPLGIPCLLFAVYAGKNLFLLGRVIPSLTALYGSYIAAPWWAYVDEYPLMLPAMTWPLLLLGVVALLRRQPRTIALMLGWVLVFWLGGAGIAEKRLRYLLPLIPALALICGMGLDSFIEIVFPASSFRRSLARVFCACLCLFWVSGDFVRVKEARIDPMRRHYLGYQEAGQWLRDHISGESKILATSPRQIRYCSFLSSLSDHRVRPFPKDQKVFDRMVDQFPGDVFLVLDCWERFVPDWLPPFEQSEEVFEGKGFSIVKVVFRKDIRSGKSGRKPVVMILRRD